MSHKIRRIQVIGGPGSGKSVIAARLFGELSIVVDNQKLPVYNVEHVTEYIKDWAYQGRFPTSFDQFYIFAKQMNREDVRLQHRQHIITDCPLLTCVAYSRIYKFSWAEKLGELAMMFEESYPSATILLDRTGIPYDQGGRYQDIESAQEVDQVLSDVVHQYSRPGSVYKMPTADFNGILSLVKSLIDSPHKQKAVTS